MSERRRRDDRAHARATGFASAVLLVVLLATTGWPVEAQRSAEPQQVSCCEVQRAQAAARRREPAARGERHSTTCARPQLRVASRAARVDSWGLPPARAPTRGR